MAWTTALPSGRVRGGYRLPDGKKIQRTFDYDYEAREWAEREEAEHAARLAALRTPTVAPLAAVDPVPAPEVTTLTVGAHGAAWLRRKGTKAKSTRDGYACHLRAIDRTGLGKELLSEVLLEDVQDWMVDMLEAGEGRPSINARLKVLRMVYRDAIANKKATHDPTDTVEFLPTDKRPHRVLSEAEQEALLFAAADDEQTRTMVLVALHSGLRWQEVAALTPSAIIGDYLNVFQVMERSTHSIRAYPKGHRSRIVPIGSERLATALAKAAKGKAHDELLFTSERGCPLAYWKWRKTVWRPLCRKARLNPVPRFHDLRHTYGTTCAMNGVARSLIAKWMGHADEKTTAIYISPSDERGDVARAIFDRPAPALVAV